MNSRTHFTTAGLAALGVFLLAACGAPPAATAVTPTSVPPPTVSTATSVPTAASLSTPLATLPLATVPPAPTQVPVVSNPTTLSDAIFAASDAETRYEALLEVMRALNIGVYDLSAGKAIVHGAERGSNDFYLYDVELKAIASGLGRGETWDTAYLADFFTQAGFVAGGNPIDPDGLRQALRAAVQSSAATPDDPSSRVFLLVRELGLRHAAPYDLLQDVPQEQLQFDALQTFLIEADVLAPVIHEAASMNLYRSMGLAVPVLFQGPCGDIAGPVSSVMPFGKYVLALVSKGAKGTFMVLEMIHGEMLAYSVAVNPVGKDFQSTHYGPEGHAPDAGQEMRFQIKVEMLDDYGDTVINCGALAGYKIPAQGGIPGVTINWTTGGLEKYGDISYDPPDKKTDANGVSTLVFKPKNEKRPGEGPVDLAAGTVGGIALYQSSLSNIPGSVAQYVQYFKSKRPIMVWEVWRHKNLSLEIEAHGTSSSGGVTTTDDLNKISIPLLNTSSGMVGHAKADWKMTSAGGCVGERTDHETVDITATGTDPLTISIKWNFLTSSETGNCFGIPPPGSFEGGPPVDLPPKDGASKTIEYPSVVGNYNETYTLREE